MDNVLGGCALSDTTVCISQGIKIVIFKLDYDIDELKVFGCFSMIKNKHGEETL